MSLLRPRRRQAPSATARHLGGGRHLGPARTDHGSAAPTTTANAVRLITCEASTATPAPKIPRCGISSHGPTDGEGCSHHA